jgi:hypothetical protein
LAVKVRLTAAECLGQLRNASERFLLLLLDRRGTLVIVADTDVAANGLPEGDPVEVDCASGVSLHWRTPGHQAGCSAAYIIDLLL